MPRKEKYEVKRVAAGIVCIGFAFWLLTIALIKEDTPWVVRLLVLPGVVVFLEGAVKGLRKY